MSGRGSFGNSGRGRGRGRGSFGNSGRGRGSFGNSGRGSFGNKTYKIHEIPAITEKDYFAIPLDEKKFNFSKPIIIPLGFDCGPADFLRGSLVPPTQVLQSLIKKKLNPTLDGYRKYKTETIKEFNFCDLPFDTVVLKDVTPIIVSMLFGKLNTDLKQILGEKLENEIPITESYNLGDNNNLIENKTNLTNTAYLDKFINFGLTDYLDVSQDTQLLQNKFNVSMKHKESYSTYKQFCEDMKIRMCNLLKIMEKKDHKTEHFKVFFRKSHCTCHHNIKYNYAFSTPFCDLDDCINLSKILKTHGYKNFIIVLFICCRKPECTTKTPNTPNTPDLLSIHNIFYEEIDDTSDVEEDPLKRTLPKTFVDKAYDLFKNDNQSPLMGIIDRIKATRNTKSGGSINLKNNKKHKSKSRHNNKSKKNKYHKKKITKKNIL